MQALGIRLPHVIRALRRAPWGALLSALLAASCTDNHSMSPWGEAGRPRLADFAVRPDLDAHLAEIEAEAARLGLREVFRVEAKDPRSGDALVAVALEGRDDVGRTLAATRIASPWGVVLARGPLDLRDVRRAAANQLLREVSVGAETRGSAEPGGGFGAFSDLNHDGTPDVVLQSEQGRIEIWSITSRGGTQLDVQMDAPPTRLVDIDGDGRVDLAGEVSLGSGDALDPHLVDVSTWAGESFSNATPEARAFHARHRDLARTAEATSRSAEDRAKRALELSWHAILAGDDATRVLSTLERKRPEGALGEAFDAYARRVARIGQ